MKKKLVVASIVIILIIELFRTIEDNLKYDTSRDKVIKSPSGKHSITLRYDYVSRPYIFKNNKLIFETNKGRI